MRNWLVLPLLALAAGPLSAAECAVTVEGNDKTRENVIRRELRLSDGDLFSGSKVKRSNERLNKLDYFDKVDVETGEIWRTERIEK